MPPKRQRIIEESPLKTTDAVRLPQVEAPPEPVKTFSYRLPARLGLKFKLWCQLQGVTAERTLAGILEDFLRDKEVKMD